ncbi:MAG: transglycosylase SLT domain-containing protein [Bacteroidota bacterium]
MVLIFFSNVVSHWMYNPQVQQIVAPAMASTSAISTSARGASLYLMEKASMFVADTESFENKVREIAYMLGVAPEWLMAVMYSESKFDAQVLNHKGSGATGLIQFMPAAASEMNVSLQRLARMSHVQQMEYVYMYLQKVRERYGEYDSLTDLYLGILYPRARKQDYCYTLYAKPSKSFKQNSGLDENKDGRVTVSDIDRRMKRLYPVAYMAEK